MADNQIPAGWYPDPLGNTTKVRYWDGVAWTEQLLDVTNPQAAQPPSRQNYNQQTYITPMQATPGATYANTTPAEEDKSGLWLGIGVASILLLTWPLAIPQIICASAAKSAYKIGDLATYRSKLKTSKICFIINLCLMLVMLPCIIVYVLTILGYIK